MKPISAAKEVGRVLAGRGAKGLERLRRLRLPRYRFLAYLGILGPGLIAASAGNDAGGIATYSSAGAGYGYSFLWMLFLSTFSLGVIQEMCARMGAATGKGLSELIRENFGIRWTAFVMLCVLFANGTTVISEFIGIAAALELFKIPRYVSIPIVTFSVWWLVVKGSYSRVEKIFLLMTFVFLGYIVSAFLAKPDWGQVARGTLIPTFHLDGSYIALFLATVGTTITPYMQISVQSLVVERGITMRDYAMERADVYFGVITSNLVAFFIVICTAATLYTHQIKVDTAEQAAAALEPFAGVYAKALFAIGLFGASMLAASVLPLATAYSISEAFGFEKGISRSFKEAPIFMGIFTGLLVLGGLTAMIPGLPLIQVLIIVQVVNGLLLPVLLVSILRLVNDEELMGEHRNGIVFNGIAWATTVVVIALSILLVITAFHPLA
ncbi:MAG TPA: Nramp family divalent metal transporter [Blastocatellia bacterium]|nr:Nramp family divalent metal transporter [Blastocatellia bacterium]